MHIIKPTLLAFAVCTAIFSAVGFNTLIGSTATTRVVPVFGQDDDDEDDTDEGNNTTPSTTPSPHQGNQNTCVLRRFECGKEALPSCFKRWRSKEISCNDALCTGNSCMSYNVFISKYTFQQWDIMDLQGPFPRNETMCIQQQSDCPIDDVFCISAVSLSQVPCEGEFCSGVTCKRQSVFVDSKDILITHTVGTSVSSASEDTTDSKDKDTTNNDRIELPTTQTEDTQKTEKSVQDAKLGCFNEQGNWTTDRTKCAVNQKPYVIPQVQKFTTPQQTDQETIPRVTTDSADTAQDEKDEIEIQQKIEEVFVPDTRKSTIVQGLLSSITEADGRLGTILSNAALPESMRSSLTKERETLASLRSAISAPNQSIINLQKLGESVSNHLQSIQSIVQSLQGDRNPPTTVTEKLDAIFAGLPEVFSLLLQEGIPVDNVMISGYIGAEAEYSPIRSTCLERVSSCNDLVQIIDMLAPVYQSLQDSLEKAGRTDLQTKIDELLK